MQIGYWSIPITSSDTNYTTSANPYIPGAWPYLLRALGWAKKHGLHVIIDLHGAPGSQNGYDNSGQRGAAEWAQGNNVARTVDIVKFIAGQIGGMIDVFELLNEPGGWQEDIAHVISDFFEDGYNAVRQAAGDSLKVMIGDAFLGVGVIIGSVYRKSEANSNCALELGWFFGLPGRPRGSDGLRQYSHYFIGNVRSLPTVSARVPDFQLRSAGDDTRRAPERECVAECGYMLGLIASCSTPVKS